MSAVSDEVSGAEAIHEMPAITAKPHIPKTPGASTSIAYARPRTPYTALNRYRRSNLSDIAPTLSTPTTLRPLISPKASAAVPSEKPRSTAKGT